MMNKPRIGIVLGTTRQGRFGDKPAAWIKTLARQRSDLDFELVDLRDHPLPFFDEIGSPAMKTPQEPAARKWAETVARLDGFLIVTGEYNRSMPAVLKNAMDYAYTEWNRKPIGFVGYGGLGAARAIEQLRLVAVELQMAPIRNAVHLPFDVYLQVLKGEAQLEDFDFLADSAGKMLDELAWWAIALKTAQHDAVREAA